MLLLTCWSWVRIRKQPLCICKGKAAYNIPPPYLRIAKCLWAMGYKVFFYFLYIYIFYNEKSSQSLTFSGLHKVPTKSVQINWLLCSEVGPWWNFEMENYIYANHCRMGWFYLHWLTWFFSFDTRSDIHWI